MGRHLPAGRRMQIRFRAAGRACYPPGTREREIAMTIKSALLAAAFLAAPTLALAEGCNHMKTAMSCGEGQVYDAEKRACVAATS